MFWIVIPFQINDKTLLHYSRHVGVPPKDTNMVAPYKGL